MPIVEVKGALGSFEIELLGSTPRELLDAIEYFGHLAIIPGRLNPLEYGDGTLSAARYVGVVRSLKLADDGRTNKIMDDTRIMGVGMNFWLGDDDDKGAIYETPIELTDVNFITAINSLLPDSVTAGTIHNIPGTYTGTHVYETPRKAIQYVCDTMSSAGFSLYDTFNRADDTDTLGTLDSGQSWVVNSGVWGISSNESYVSSAGYSIATVDAAADFAAQITVADNGTGDSYLVFRLSDTGNYWRFGAATPTGNITLDKIEGGVLTTVGSTSVPMGDSTTLKVVADGSAIYGFINGSLEIVLTHAFNADQTFIGMATSVTDVRFDTFNVLPDNDPISYRVNNDASVDAGPESQLFVTEPTCVVVRKGSSYGEDLFLRSLPTTLDIDLDMEDFSTRTVMLGEASGDSFITGTADISNVAPGLYNFKDLLGNDLSLTRLVSESDTVSQNADVRAELALRQYLNPHRELTLATDDYDIYGSFVVGDHIYVYDPDSGMFDLSNEVIIRGERINPIKLQVMEVDWPVTQDYSVAFRAHDGTWYDLTDYMHFEEVQPSNIVVGDVSRSLIEVGESVPSRLATSPTPPNLTIPAAPDWVTSSFQTVTYLDSHGFAKARQKLVWQAPLNTDGSAITDGGFYEIQYRLDTGGLYSQTWGAASTLTWDALNTWEQPVEPDTVQWESTVIGWGENSIVLHDLATGTAYDFRIRAIDNAGNQSAWSAQETWTTSEDDIPPSAPQAPTVASSMLAIQVTHTLGKASGGTYNLEKDIAHLEVHYSYDNGFFPSDATKAGLLRANAGMMAAGTPTIGTFTIPETENVYVKVIAVDRSGNRSGASEAVQASAVLIDSQHVSEITASKISAGTISANWILGASIRTADTGARIDISSEGIQAYNAENEETFSVNAESGDVEMVGTLKSKTGDGGSVQINPAGGANEIRFYSEDGTSFARIAASNDPTVTDANASMHMMSSFDDNGNTSLSALLEDRSAFGRYYYDDDGYLFPRGGAMQSTDDWAFMAHFEEDFVYHGFVYATEDGLRSGYSGHNSLTADNPNSNYWWHTPTGSAHFYGTFQDFGSYHPAQGIITGHVNEDAGTGTHAFIVVNYGATMDSVPYPLGNFVDQDGTNMHVEQADNLTTTSFQMNWNTDVSGQYQFYWWAYRLEG